MPNARCFKPGNPFASRLRKETLLQRWLTNALAPLRYEQMTNFSIVPRDTYDKDAPWRVSTMTFLFFHAISQLC